MEGIRTLEIRPEIRDLIKPATRREEGLCFALQLLQDISAKLDRLVETGQDEASEIEGPDPYQPLSGESASEVPGQNQF